MNHPEGTTKFEVPVARIIAGGKDFFEFTGKAGDVVLAHPLTLHAESHNFSKRPRFLTARTIELSAPMNFNRADPGEFSLIERATLRALGRERLDFRRSA
jgi:hypothetical protein